MGRMTSVMVRKGSKRTVVLIALAVGLSSCVSRLASGPWPSSSDREVVGLDHPSWETHLASLLPFADHRVVFFGDQRALADGEWQAMIEAIVEREGRMEALSPLIGIIDSGDIVFDGNHRDQFHMLAEILAPLRPWPYLVGVGNHEVHANRGAKARRNVVDFLGPSIGPEFRVDRLYYRKDAPGHHLIFLDTNDLVYGADGSRSRRMDLDDRGRAQMQWLVRELGSIDEEEWTTVILHHPFLTSSTKHEGHAQKVWSLRFEGLTLPQILAEGGVDLVLAGHTHTYERFHLQTRTGAGFDLINVSGRPRGEFLGIGKGGRRARRIAGEEIADLKRRGWKDLEGWRIEQLDAMVDAEADQWVELRIASADSVVGEVFFLRDGRSAVSGGSFILGGAD